MASQLKDENEIKIFILYLLDKIGYPLDYPSIGSIMMQDGIVNFFDFAENFFALVDAGHIREIMPPELEAEIADETKELTEEDLEETESEHTILYEVTETGRQVARGLSDKLMVAVREKSYRSALRHLSFAKRGAYIDYSYKPDGDGYLLNCSIRESKGSLMDLTVKVDSDYQLDRMIHNFSSKPEVVFRGVMALLSGDVNYLFEA